MLGKLLKHEFKVTSHFCLPVILTVVVITALLKIAMVLSEGSIFVSLEINTFINIIQGLFTALYVIILIGTSILVLFLLIKRFYSNMFGDEGYLTHSLPVTGGQLLNSKLICSFVWIMLLVPIWILSFCILFIGSDFAAVISYYVSVLIEEFAILNMSGFSIGLLVTECVLSLILGLIGSILCYYLSITLGHHFFGEHRLLGAIAFYFILSIINSTISSVFSTILENGLAGNLSYITLPAIFHILSVMLAFGILITLIQIILYYLITRHFLTHKLNLY